MARKKPAFAVKCDETNNSPEDVAAGKVRVDVSIAVADPRGSVFPGTGTSAKINGVPLAGSRELVTVGPEDGIWKGERETKQGTVEGAIVRLRPPAAATDEEVERVRAEFAGKKAERVVVMPRPRAELVPASVAEAAKGKAYGAREAVLTLVSESNAKDRDALAKLCEQIMSEVGL